MFAPRCPGYRRNDNTKLCLTSIFHLPGSALAKIMDPTLPMVYVFGYWAIILGSFGGPSRGSLDARTIPQVPGAHHGASSGFGGSPRMYLKP